MNSSNTAPLDSRQLRAFVTLARTGSFTRAAKELYLTQSAVSRQIRSLEEELGATLFLRGTRHVELTPDGKLLQTAVESILGDGKQLWSSQVAYGNRADVTLPLSGVLRLRLQATTNLPTPEYSPGWDNYAAFGSPQVLCSS